MNRKFDWDAIEKQYVSGEMSLRELARLNGIANHSLVTAQSSRRGWAKKRADFQSRAEERTYALLATEEGRRRVRESQVRDNAIDLIDEAITTMRSQLKEKRVVVRNGESVEEPLILMKPESIALLIDRLNILFGRPSTITEERNLGINLSARGLEPDLLRGIVEATRGLADTDRSSISPIPRLDRAGEGGGG